MANRGRKRSTPHVPKTAPDDRTSQRFPLAPLIKLDPHLIVPPNGDDRFSMFMLALAVVFNDLKGVYLLAEFIAPLEPPVREVSGHAGQWRGLDLQVHRIRIGLIHELLQLIEEFKLEAMSEEINSLLQNAPRKTKSDWTDLVSISLKKGQPSERAFARRLVQIRNNVAFHYHQPKRLVAGYRDHFFNSPKNPSNEYAYCSIGENMEETRFYFGDAAISGALASLQGETAQKDFLPALIRVSESINRALEHILEEYTRPARIP